MAPARMAFLAALVVLNFAMALSPICGADAQPVLVVPTAQVTQHVSATLPQWTARPVAERWQLCEVDHPDWVIPAQLVTAIAADGSANEAAFELVADIPPREDAGSARRFRLEPAARTAADGASLFQFKDVTDKSLGLWEGDAAVFVYNHGVITCETVPEKDHRRSRGCYIHPVWGLNGEILTDDFPRDHYHHHGVFWTWPHVKIGDEEYDLWAGSRIEDKFVRWICRETGPIAAVLAVENGWFVGEKKVMVERVWMRSFKAADGTRSIDLDFTWIPTDRPVTLWGAGGKSYGGLTVRFAPPSRRDGSTVITVPGGPTTEDLPDTPLTWADFTTQYPNAPTTSGAAVFVHPSHPDYPPTWLTRYYGPLCVGWPGIMAKTFEPGQPIRLNYRIWIHKTAVKIEEMKQAYAGYCSATAWQ